MSIGQEISVTAVQMVAAFAAIANGGRLMQPQIVRAVLDGQGREVRGFEPKAVRQVISPETARELTTIMTAVVREGTGHNAAIPGYEVAGKTGTAQKMDPATRRYSHAPGVLSFVGFAPADDPRLAMIVLLDEPKNEKWGSEAAAPIFAAIGLQALRHMNVPPRGTTPCADHARHRRGRRLDGSCGWAAAAPLRLASLDDGSGDARVMPALQGRSLRGAMAALAPFDVALEVQGPRRRRRPVSRAGNADDGRHDVPPDPDRAGRDRTGGAAGRESMSGDPVPTATLLEALADKRVLGPIPATVRGVAYDSRTVKPGELFVAVPGLKQDGRRYVEDALARGAAAVVLEGPDLLEGRATGRVLVPSSREALARLADAYFGHPSGELTVIGITGTNGKTTTSYLVDALLTSRGQRTGLIGTVQYRVGTEVRPAGQTTPEAVELQSLLRRMVDAGRLGRRHGSLLPRARALARGRHRLRRRGLHQPDAGPPRLPRDHGRVPGSQAAPLRPAGRRAQARPRGRGERRRSRRGPAWSPASRSGRSPTGCAGAPTCARRAGPPAPRASA